MMARANKAFPSTTQSCSVFSWACLMSTGSWGFLAGTSTSTSMHGATQCEEGQYRPEMSCGWAQSNIEYISPPKQSRTNQHCAPEGARSLTSRCRLKVGLGAHGPNTCSVTCSKFLWYLSPGVCVNFVFVPPKHTHPAGIYWGTYKANQRPPTPSGSLCPPVRQHVSHAIHLLVKLNYSTMARRHCSATTAQQHDDRRHNDGTTARDMAKRRQHDNDTRRTARHMHTQHETSHAVTTVCQLREDSAETVDSHPLFADRP